MIIVANCQIKNRMIPEHHLNRVLEDCISHTGIEQKNICLSFSPIILQAGKPFELIINLFLPVTLQQEDAKRIITGLPAIMARHLAIRPEDIWTTTTLTQPETADKP
jgi:hypothetical protein